jgi:multidrug efflux pump
VKKAFASGLFIFADADLKFDQPQAEVVLRSRQAAIAGVDLSEAGRDLSTLLGANYVNRFSIQGRSYKVIPQVMRAERLTPDQLEQIYVTGSRPNGPAAPRSAVDVRQPEDDDRTARPQEVPAAERGAHPGRHSAAGAARSALGFLEDEARKILPQGFNIDYAGESRQLRTEGGGFLGHLSAVGRADLPRAGGAVRELPRSVSSCSPARCRWRCRAR